MCKWRYCTLPAEWPTLDVDCTIKVTTFASIYRTHSRAPDHVELTKGSMKLQQMKGCLVSSEGIPLSSAGRQYNTNKHLNSDAVANC